DHPCIDRLPIIQKKISFTTLSDIETINETKEPRNAETTTHERMIDSKCYFPWTLASRKTTNRLDSAVIKATKGIVQVPNKAVCNPNNITTAAPTAAPEDTPKIYGSAKGFRKTP